MKFKQLNFCMLHAIADKTIFYGIIRHSLSRKWGVFIFAFSFIFNISANTKGKKIGSIPFESVGSYIIVKVRINESSALNFILDTGVRNIVITELMPEDSIALNYIGETNLHGLGTGNELNAFSSKNNRITMGKVKLENINVYVLKEDIFNLSKHTGVKINGLIGIDFFEDYLVEINYSRHRIRFFENEAFKMPKGYGMMPISVEMRKMYIQLSVLETDSTSRNIKMLIDTGAELNAWFQTMTNESVQLPDNGVQGRIGHGLNGEVTGLFARIPQICIGKYCLKNPIVAFPDSAAISDIIFGSDRDGTIGSQILSRFNLFIDYKNKRFYYKPNENFNKQFTYNIAGIEIGQTVPLFPQTEILNVWKNSPAEIAGVQVGDQLVEVNDTKAFQMKLSEIKMLFETPSKYPLILKLNREGVEIKLKIEMKNKL